MRRLNGEINRVISVHSGILTIQDIIGDETGFKCSRHAAPQGINLEKTSKIVIQRESKNKIKILSAEQPENFDPFTLRYNWICGKYYGNQYATITDAGESKIIKYRVRLLSINIGQGVLLMIDYHSKQLVGHPVISHDGTIHPIP